MSDHRETSFIHDGVTPDPQTGATQVPIYQSAGFAFDASQSLEDVFQGREFGHYYSRVANPTVTAVETRLSAIEKGLGAVLFSSGMAAISNTLLSLAAVGDSIVVGKSLFGSTYYMLKGAISDAGIDVRFVDSTDTAAFEAAIDETTKVLYVEALGNPKLDVPDLKALVALANSHGIPLVVDTTFVTPYLLPAKSLGIHVVCCATTKYLTGGGSTVGGVVVDTGVMDWNVFSGKAVSASSAYGRMAFLSALRKTRANLGSCLSPFNAFLIALGCDTLALRMQRHCNNALVIARFLQQHPAVESVNYPGLESHPFHQRAMTLLNGGFGGMIGFRVGSKQRAFDVIDRLTVVKNLVNLGDAKSLAVYPASTIYRNLTPEQRIEAGVYDDLIRFSVGLEHPDDIISDLNQALEEVA